MILIRVWSLIIYRKPLIPEKALLSHNIAQAKGQFLHTLSESYSRNYEEFSKSTNDAGSFLDDCNAQTGVCGLCLFGLVFNAIYSMICLLHEEFIKGGTRDYIDFLVGKQGERPWTNKQGGKSQKWTVSSSTPLLESEAW